MATKIIYLDGVAKAWQREDQSVRIEIAPEMPTTAISTSLNGVWLAIRRARPYSAPANVPYVPEGGDLTSGSVPGVTGQAERAL